MNVELVMAQLVANCVLLNMTETKEVKFETQKMYGNYGRFMASIGHESPSFEDFVFMKAKVPDLRFIYHLRDTVQFAATKEGETADWRLGYVIGYEPKADSEMMTIMTDAGERRVNVNNIRRAKLPKELLNLAVSLARTE